RILYTFAMIVVGTLDARFRQTFDKSSVCVQAVAVKYNRVGWDGDILAYSVDQAVSDNDRSMLYSAAWCRYNGQIPDRVRVGNGSQLPFLGCRRGQDEQRAHG